MSDEPQVSEAGENSSEPDYVIRQYRRVRTDDGWATRKERIGAAWLAANGAINLRFSGMQIVSNDVYLFPRNDPR